MSDEFSDARKRSGISTFIVMVSTALSRVLGFVRAAVIGAVFGGEGAVDVYNVVFTIPNTLRNLLAEGALSSAFIPVMSATLVEDTTQKRAQALIKTITGFQFLILVPFLVLCVVFAGPIVHFLLHFKDPANQLLAVDLFSTIIHYVLLVSISAVLMAVLNSHNRFAAPALAPLMFSITTIASVFLFGGQLSIQSLVVGVIAGGVLQILVMIPGYLRQGYRLGADIQFRKNEDFKKVLRLWGPVVGTAAIFAVNDQIAFSLVSTMAPGSATALTVALLFWQLPFGIFSASITTVLFPRMSRHIAADEQPELKETVLYGLKMLINLLIPSAIFLMLFGREIIAVAIQRGEYGAKHTELAAQVLWAYSLGLLSVGAARFLQRLFYAKQDFKKPLFSAISIILLDVGLSIIFMLLGGGVQGLAYAFSIASTVGCLLLFLSARKVLGGLRVRSLLISSAKTLLACVPMIVGVLIFLNVSGPWWVDGSTLKNWIYAIVISLGCAVSVLLMFLLLRVEVVRFFLRRRNSGSAGESLQ